MNYALNCPSSFCWRGLLSFGGFMNNRATDWVGNPDAWLTLVPEQSDEGPLITYLMESQAELQLPTVLEEITSFVIASHILSPHQVVSVLDDIAEQIENYG